MRAPAPRELRIGWRVIMPDGTHGTVTSIKPLDGDHLVGVRHDDDPDKVTKHYQSRLGDPFAARPGTPASAFSTGHA